MEAPSSGAAFIIQNIFHRAINEIEEPLYEAAVPILPLDR